MKNFKLNKIFIFAVGINLLLSCGYQPILNKDNQNFSISKFNLEGNKRISGLLKNNLISTKWGENRLVAIYGWQRIINTPYNTIFSNNFLPTVYVPNCSCI